MSKKRRPGRDPEMDSNEAPSDVTVVDVEKGQSVKAAKSSSQKNEEAPLQTSFGEEEAYANIDQSADTDQASQVNAGSEATSNSSQSTGSASEADEDKIEINFKGSEILRAKFPKPFSVAEQIATDWVKDGRFEGLELGHPLAQYFAAKGLRKAKEIEKKVMESPMTEKLAMQALTAGMKAQEILSQVREKVKK